MKRSRVSTATVLAVGSGFYGQSVVDDAPAYRCVPTRKLRKGLLFLSCDNDAPVKILSHAELPFHPQWIAWRNGTLYAAGDDDKLHSLSIDGERKVTVTSSVDSLGGSAHVEISADGRWAICANYGSGVLCVLPLAKDGTIGPATDSKQPWPLEGLPPALEDRQEACHPHQVRLCGRWVLACDLGAARVWVSEFAATRGALVGAINSDRHLKLDNGSGPRHLAVHPNGKWLYILCELSGQAIHCDWDAANGRITEKAASNVMQGADRGCSRAHHSGLSHIEVHDNMLYCASRTDNVLVAFSINAATGALSPFRQRISTSGVCPRHFTIVPRSRLLVVGNQDTQTVLAFRIMQDGTLEAPKKHEVQDTTGTCPNCIIELPRGEDGAA